MVVGYVCMKPDLTSDNTQWLICHKTNEQLTTNQLRK